VVEVRIFQPVLLSDQCRNCRDYLRDKLMVAWALLALQEAAVPRLFCAAKPRGTRYAT
jgi:hypothetical protein